MLEEADIFQLETAILDLRPVSDDELKKITESCQDTADFIHTVVRGDYVATLSHWAVAALLGDVSAAQEQGKGLLDAVEEATSHYMQQSASDDEQLLRELVLLSLAVSCLQLYVQCNWVGPPVTQDALPQTLTSLQNVEECLCVDGEVVYPHSHHLVCLSVAWCILLQSHFTHCKTAPWWLMRCLQIHQALLDERSPTLKSSMMEVSDKMVKTESLMASDKLKHLAIQFHLEAGYLCYFYYEPSDAHQHFRTAEKLTGLDIQLTGVMGKRTRFQESDIAQLILSVKRQNSIMTTQTPAACLPKNVFLDDDTVLEDIQLSDQTDECDTELSGEEQAVILALCQHHRKTHEGQGKIVEEECMAHVKRVLRRSVSWSVCSSALLQRAWWEGDSMRRVGRAMMQLEELVGQWGREAPPSTDRLPLIYCSHLPSIWSVKRELGNFLIKLGSVNSALEVFLGLSMWEEVIRCYTMLGRREKAEKLIREQLAVEETANLWCYLGDVTSQAEHYERAWQVSGGRSSRAQRSLGFLHMKQQKFQESLPHFEKSLQVNSLQVGVWFSYGCASLASQNFDLAAKAFRRCVTLTEHNHEAWSNLATAYIRTNQKPRAFVALQEALKGEYEDWRIWENYLYVATDVGEFSEAMRAYHRLLDLRDKFTDVQVVGVLVRAVCEGLEDASAQNSSSHRPHLLKLLGRITSKVTSNGDLWHLYAQLVLGGDQPALQQGVQYLQRAHRCHCQKSGWESDPAQRSRLTALTSQLTQAVRELSQSGVDSVQLVQTLSSARLAVRGLLNTIKKTQVDTVSGEVLSDVEGDCTSLQTDLDTLNTLLDQTKVQTE